MGNRSSSSQSQTKRPVKIQEPPVFKRRAYWMFKNASSEPSENWTHYSDIDNEIIEDAFSSDKSEIVLNNDYIIDLKNLLQISRIDLNSQPQQIKRETDIVFQEYVREERFHLPIAKVKAATISHDSLEMHPPLIIEWAKIHNVKADLFTLVGNRDFQNGLVFFQRIIKMASDGIIQHGTELEKKEEAEWISNQLLQALSKFEQEKQFSIVEDCCISLYTRESFLYKSVNKMLREEDSSQVEVLGPFCYLLNGFIEAQTYDFGTGCFTNTFRGVNLTPAMLGEYKHASEKKFVFTWPGFTSTSRSREKAEIFGNTLFIFTNSVTRAATLTGDTHMVKRGLSIERKSVFPGEMEVLYPANSRFIVGKIEENPTTGKIIIHLNRIKQ